MSNVWERETEEERGRERNEEAYLWLWPETAVSLQCVEDGSSLISSPSCHFIYAASLLSLEGQSPTASLERERKSIWLSDQSPLWRMVFYKRMPSCKCLLLLLFCKDLDRNGRCCSRLYWLFKMTLWQVGCRSDTADLTLSMKVFRFRWWCGGFGLSSATEDSPLLTTAVTQKTHGEERWKNQEDVFLSCSQRSGRAASKNTSLCPLTASHTHASAHTRPALLTEESAHARFCEGNGWLWEKKASGFGLNKGQKREGGRGGSKKGELIYLTCARTQVAVSRNAMAKTMKHWGQMVTEVCFCGVIFPVWLEKWQTIAGHCFLISKQVPSNLFFLFIFYKIMWVEDKKVVPFKQSLKLNI